MREKAVSFVVFSLLLAVLGVQFLTPVRATTWTVDDDGPANFSTIQEAVDAANSGDTIQVKAGTYYEHVAINKSLTLVGEDSATTIIDGSGTGTVVYITSSDVNISSFTIRNGGDRYYGIVADGFGGYVIADNMVLNNVYGIDLIESNGNTIVGNTVFNNSMIGIHLTYSDNNLISNNSVSESAYDIKLDWSNDNSIANNTLSNSSYGVYLSSSSRNDINGNDVSGRTVGIYSVYSNDNTIVNNTASECAYGIYVYGSQRNTVLHNTASYNSYGIRLAFSTNNLVDRNRAQNNDWSLELYDSDNNEIARNTMSVNTWGIYLSYSDTTNTIHHNNLIHNVKQMYRDPSSSNTWDDGAGEGNYWSDYEGEDLDGDGVGDTDLPHKLVDYYPLMSPWSEHDVAIVSVTLSATEVYVGQVVNITVVAANEGEASETFTVTVYANATVVNFTSVTLASGDTTTLTVSWNTTGVTPGNYTISARASTVPHENDTADNTFVDDTVKVKILGDVNGDGTVNILDALLLRAAFGSTLGEPNWNPDADLNQDNVINLLDALLLRDHYGEDV